MLTVPAGAQLGRYEIVKHLASGLMAELLLARARGLEGFERHFVIKRIRAEQERDEAFIEMFLAEARLAAALHHHNIVQVHDIGEDDGKPYFAMEYVHGEDLRRVLARLFEQGEHMPLEHVISIVCSVAGALHHAHEAVGPDRQSLGIVHRDVTPANILLGYDGNVKVVDFGIARAVMRRTETQAGMLVGKAPYMAPEQCVGGAIDRRSDVFALGIVLFELITGRRLFKGDNEFLTMSAVVEANVPAPSAHRSDVSPALDKIVLKALSRDPAQRYQTAEQMFYALDMLASSEGLRSSGLALAAFMKDLFGHRVEPWLGNDDRPRSTSPDFDGAYPGLAAPPTGAFDNYSDPSAKKVSPITRARNNAISDQPATKPAAIPQAIGEQRSAAVRIPEGPVVAQGRPRDKAAFRTTQVPVAPMPTRSRPKTKTVQIPVSPKFEPTDGAATRVDPMADLLEIPVEPAAPPVPSSAVKVDSTAPSRKDPSVKIVSTSAPRKDATPPPPPKATSLGQAPLKVDATSAPRKDATPPPKATSLGQAPLKVDATNGAANSATAPTGNGAAAKSSASAAAKSPTSDASSASAAAKLPTSDASSTSASARSPASGASKSPASDASNASTPAKPASSPRPSSGLSVTAFAQKPGGTPATSKLPSLMSSSTIGASTAPSSSAASTSASSSAASPITAPSSAPSSGAAMAASSSAAAAPMPTSSAAMAASSSAAAAPTPTLSAAMAASSSAAAAPMPASSLAAAAPIAASSSTKRNTPPPMQPLATEAPTRKTPPPMQALEAPPVLAASSQAMAPVVEAESTKTSSRRLPLPGVIENEPETHTEIDPLSSRHGEVAANTASIWNNPDVFSPDEPSVVVRSKSLVMAALAAEAAKTDAEDARADEEAARVRAEARADSEAQTFAEQTEIDDGPTGVADESIADDGPTSVMPDRPANELPQPPVTPAGWTPPAQQRVGPPERGSQDRITPLPPPPLMPEITDYPRLRPDHESAQPAPTATPTPVPGWMPAAPTVDASPMSTRKKKLIIAGAGALLLLVILVFAMRGGDDETAARGGSDDIATPESPELAPTPTETPAETPAPTEPPTPTETATDTGMATPAETPTPPPDKTTARPTKKPVKPTSKVSTKPVVKKAPVKKTTKKAPVVKKTTKKKPPPKQQGWDPNSLFPKKK